MSLQRKNLRMQKCTICDINDDCLREIIEYLEFSDQLRLWQSTNDKTRLHLLMTQFWQRQANHSLNYKLFEKDPKLMKKFVQNIYENVKKLQLISIPFTILENLKCYSFPHLNTLACKVPKANDSYIALLAIIFPSVISFKPVGPISGRDIANWPHLVELDIGQCQLITNESFQHICEQLKLQKLRVSWKSLSPKSDKFYIEQVRKLHELQELEITWVFSLSVTSLQKLVRMPKLEKLGFVAKAACTILRLLLPLLGPDIVGITYHDSINFCTVYQLLQLKILLRKLTIINETEWGDLDMTRIIYDMPFVEELYVVQTSIWNTAEGLWEMVASCPNLKVLYLSGSLMDNWFFNCDKTLMEYALERRSKPLTLHFHALEPNKDLIRQNFQHANLRVSFEAVEVEYISPRFIKLEFVSLERSKR